MWGTVAALAPWPLSLEREQTSARVHAALRDYLDESAAYADVASTLHEAMQTGLKRRVWNGRREDADAFSLAGASERAYWLLRPFRTHGGAGLYVCEGDARGPGCGLVFTASCQAKLCPICHRSRIRFAHLPGDTYAWAREIPTGLRDETAVVPAPFNPGARKLIVYRDCVECGERFGAGRMDRPHCSKRCKQRAYRKRQRQRP